MFTSEEPHPIPMAIEMGLGVTTWSPLKSGALSGKYTRENVNTVKPDRGELVMSTLGDRAFDIIDELIRIAGERNTTAAAIALAWVQGRPGVRSTIIGSRRIDQLEQNIAALDVHLTPAETASLDNLSQPTLNFPAMYLRIANMLMHGGATVNGETSERWPLAPVNDSERY